MIKNKGGIYLENIKYLLKFGQKEHLKQLKNQDLFFSNAISIRGIEENLHIKGQGDKLEGSSKIFSDSFKMIDNNTRNVIIEGDKINATIHFEPADKIPVFCLFAVMDKDCIKTNAGKLAIKLSQNTKNTI